MEYRERRVYVGLFSRSYDGFCKKARTAAESANFQEAEDLFLAATMKDPNRPVAYAGLGMIYQKLTGYNPRKDREELGELSVRRLDEAIVRESNPETRAEYWWQRGITLDLLKRTSERDKSWQEANNIVPGFTDHRNARSAWMDKRTCETCGKTFTVSDHGDFPAWAAAERQQNPKLGDKRGPGNAYALGFCPIHVKQKMEAMFIEAAEELKKKGML